MAANNRSLIELPKLNVEGVLLRLPLPSLLVCCCVSKSLLNLIKNDSDFARKHFAKMESQLMIHSPIGSSFHLIDLDADTTPAIGEVVETVPSFNLPLDGFAVTHSCNGLVLLENVVMDDVVRRCIVCNPVTGEYTMLPEPTSLSRNVRSAFFYCSITKQFKVFRVFHLVFRLNLDSESSAETDPNSFMDLDLSSDSVISDHDSNLDSDTNMKELDLYSNSDSSSFSESESQSESDSDSMYSDSDIMGEFLQSGFDSWEVLDDIPFSPVTIYSPCYLEKATHWLCVRTLEDPALCDDKNVSNLIVFFNFETRQVGEISAPAHMDMTRESLHDDMNLIVLDGFLSIFDNFTTKTQFDIWRMKEYGVKDSWSKDFVIDMNTWPVYGPEFTFKPVICRSNGEVVMVSWNGYIMFYDLLKKTGRVLSYPLLQRPWEAVAHTPSLISLRENMRDSNLVVLDVAERFAPPDITGPNRRNYLELAATFPE